MKKLIDWDSKMSQVAKILGVKILEPFFVREFSALSPLKVEYRLTYFGVEYFNTSRQKWMHSNILEEILCGYYLIVKSEV